jgi:hypothetical protein
LTLVQKCIDLPGGLMRIARKTVWEKVTKKNARIFYIVKSTYFRHGYLLVLWISLNKLIMKSANSFSKKLIKSLSITLLFFSIFLGPVGNLYAQAPTITSFSPASGSVGTLVTITGTNLGSPTAFSIGGVSAIIVSNSGTNLVGMVMPGATTGTVSVTTAGGEVGGGGNFTVVATPFPSMQQGGKLVGTANTGAAGQGQSVSISADGNTAIVGGNRDNSNQGAVWVYTRIGGNWTQQGPKLVGTGNIGAAQQGVSVSLSADGNTALVGGPGDNSNQGAVWVFVRNGDTWTQQGGKLVGTANFGEGAQQGRSVSISADGNTAIVGAPNYYSILQGRYMGTAFVFIRTGSIWTQQGSSLIGTIGQMSRQGMSVSISADGNTAIVGGTDDGDGKGAAWVYTRTNGIWTQQGAKLIGTGNIGFAQQGTSVSLSADGNTAIVGGQADNSFQGAAWVYTRSSGIWTQQGSKLVGTGNTGSAWQGRSVSLSADGNTAILGGYADNSGKGATWVFKRNNNTWAQQGTKMLGTDNIGAGYQGWSASLSSDGRTVIVGGYNGNSGQGAAWVFVSVPKLYFRSIQSGNWNDPNTWESSPVADFSSGLISPAALPPGAEANGINIREGHIVTVTQNVSVRQIFVHPAATLSIIGCTLTQIED